MLGVALSVVELPATFDTRQDPGAPALIGKLPMSPRVTSWTVPEPELGTAEVHEIVTLSAASATPPISAGIAKAVASNGAQSQASPWPSKSESIWSGL